MIQVVIILVLLMGAGGFGAYSWVTKLQAENKVLLVNQEQLEDAVTSQEAVIATQQADAAKIQTQIVIYEQNKQHFKKIEKILLTS